MSENIQPLPPYKGTEPYIFISYSHINQLQALKIVERLQKEGYRVWYDEGIDPGTEWDDNIAEHVLACGYFVALISKNYLASENCKDELNLAREENKQRLLVYLEDVTLPAGMRMRLNRLQAIHKYKYPNEDGFMEKFRETRGIEGCLEKKAEQTVPERKDLPKKNEAQPSAPKKEETAPGASKREENAAKKSEERPKTEPKRAKEPSAPASVPSQESAKKQSKDPYIYISYSHKDQEAARALVNRLSSKGINVRFDEGIEAGTEWVEYIANMVTECAHFMPLISQNYVVSQTCTQELSFAAHLKKKILPLYMEDTKLPNGIELLLSIYQGVFRSNFGSEQDFFEAVSTLPMLKDCQKNPSAAEKIPVPAEEQVPKTKQAPSPQKQESAPKEQAPQNSPPKEASAPAAKGEEPTAAKKQPAPTSPEDARRKEIRMLLLYAKELLEKGEQDHARQRLYSAVISSEELFKELGQKEDLNALEEAHGMLAESFLSSGMLLEAETHFGKSCDVKKKQTGEEPLLALADFYERLTDAAAAKKDLPQALRLADKSFDCRRRLLQSDPQSERYKTDFERIAAKEHQLKLEEQMNQAKDDFSQLKKKQDKLREEAQKEQRWEEFFSGGKDLKLEPSYKELNTKPHLFIDFVQADEAKAKKIINYLRERGYRVAYPTKGGFLKKTNVKDQVKKATVFLPLISQSYLKERGDQLDQLCSWYGVHDCFIYLENCELPRELKLRLSAKDSLKIHNFLYPRNFFNALYNTHNVKRCK